VLLVIHKALQTSATQASFGRPLLLLFSLQGVCSLGSRAPRGGADRAPGASSVMRGRHSPCLTAAHGFYTAVCGRASADEGLGHNSKSS